MAVITSISKNRTATASKAAEREASEFDGLWINVGVTYGEGDDATFVRLPRGVAISDLKPRKVYENMDPDFAAQVNLMNQMISIIQQKSLKLAEGESVPINLTVQLYRRQEEADVVPDTASTADLEAALFG